MLKSAAKVDGQQKLAKTVVQLSMVQSHVHLSSHPLNTLNNFSKGPQNK